MDPISLSIAIVTVANLPEGTGRTGRLRTLAAALVGLGHKVVIWNQHSLESRGVQKTSGTLGGANYEYVLGTTERKWGFGAIKLKLEAVRRILGKVRRASAAGELDLVIFNHLAYYDTFPITRLARKMHVPTVQCYEDERRELVGKVGLAQRVFGLNSWMADRWCSPMADQIWVISSYLQKKYTQLSGHPDRVLIVPTIIDCGAWPVTPESVHSIPILLYSGGFAEQDDVEKLARALGCLKKQKVDFRMRFLGGNPDTREVQSLKLLIDNLGLTSHVDFLGFCPAETVKREVFNANLLVNLRTNSLWSRSGLSTKLSEYLAAGRAVLTTNIGDNALYVKDGESALVVSPEAPAESVAEVLKTALENPQLRQTLGTGARQAALTHFDIPVVQKVIEQALSRISRTNGRRR
jgi:glycosyltransferase involved in cell wall biosynthesis